MNRRNSKRVALVGLFVALVVVIAFSAAQSPAHAQSGGSYDLTWNSIDGGGATFSTGGTYSLGGTIGQSDASVLSGGSYTLAGGFWGSSLADIFKMYLPVILKNP